MLLVGRSGLVVTVQFAAPLGLSDVDPVGSLVAGAGEALGLDEGFQQNGSVSGAVLPVLGELTRGQGQQPWRRGSWTGPREGSRNGRC